MLVGKLSCIVIKVRKEGILLNKTNHSFENEGVLNPAAMQVGNTVHLFYRAVHKGNYSTVGYCLLDGPMNVIMRDTLPLISGESPFESKGVEDPRTVYIDGTYYLTYTAYDGVNALGALITSKDLKTFERKGIIVPLITYHQLSQFARENGKIPDEYFHFHPKVEPHDPREPEYVWNKDLILFPRKINGQFAIMHRIKPDIQIEFIDEIENLTPAFWEDHCRNLSDHIMMRPEMPHEASYIGGGCPPIETQEGWLIIYHGVLTTGTGNEYTACAALFELDNPQKEISRLPYPLFKPEHEWERVGEVNNVCFPTGTSLFDDTLYIYYGAADERIATASLSLSGLIKELLRYA